MIVVDTNVIASIWLPNNMDEWAYKVLKKDSEWIAPLLWRSEFRNVLSLYFRKNILELTSIWQILEEAEHFMNDNEFEVNSTQIMSLVTESSCSAYDCEFVALAEDFNIKLITFDKKIIKEFSDIAFSPQEFIG